jgi:uncharacterized membrane protein
VAGFFHPAKSECLWKNPQFWKPEEMTIPTWALAIAYWSHMLATVLWIGGLAVLAILVLPAAYKTLDTGAFCRLLENLQKRLDPLGWFCIALLLVSGMFQMSANPHYDGFLAIQSVWAWAILVKHALFGVMVVTSGMMTWGVLPALRREALRFAGGKEVAGLEKRQRKSIMLMQVNLVLGILVLFFTAIARST